MDKIVRTICYFTRNPGSETLDKLNEIQKTLEENGYEVQTRRICCPDMSPVELKKAVEDDSVLLSAGSVDQLDVDSFVEAGDVAVNLDLTDEKIEMDHVDTLYEIMERNPDSTFKFAFSFNNRASSPYHPPAEFEEEGFSIGMQSTNLSEGCETLDEWLERMEECWKEIDDLFRERDDYIGIDSSIAPFSDQEGSLVNFMKRLGLSFEESVLTDRYVRITDFIQEKNPRPAGLCGLMLPCLEDFELADQYEKGDFSLERNIFMSLHSALGVDTYPIGVDEDREKVLDLLKTVKALSNKHDKPLLIRLVSDGEARAGEKTDFDNYYLKDVEIRSL